MFRKQLFDTSRGRVIAQLQRGPATAEELAAALAVTASGVRAQLTAMERDGLIQRVGSRPTSTRPSRLYELTPDVEHLLSRAYLPLLTHLVAVFSQALSERQVDSLLKSAGKALARDLMAGKRPTGSVRHRLEAASHVLNDLGALTRVEKNGEYTIRGTWCPLSALTGKHRAVCLAMESVVKEVSGVAVRECCERAGRPRCCFVHADTGHSTD